MSTNESRPYSCHICGSTQIEELASERSVLNVCTRCGFSTRTYQKLLSKSESKSQSDQPSYIPSGELEPLKQGKGYSFSGVSNSWAPMEKWGRCLGEAKRATISFNLNTPLKDNSVLRAVMVMPSKSAEAMVQFTIEDRRVLKAKLSGSNTYYLEADVPYEWVCHKKKVDLNIYTDYLSKEKGLPQKSIGISKLTLSEVNGLTSTIAQLNRDELPLPYVHEKLHFSNMPGSSIFKSSLAEYVASTVLHYPPEEFGIWLNDVSNVLRFMAKENPSRLIVTLASPVLEQRGVVGINGQQMVEFCFNEKFINVIIDLTSFSSQNSFELSIDVDTVVDMSTLEGGDERDISVGLVSLEIQ